jgi:transcriptional regulator with XRE-family HTH domain
MSLRSARESAGLTVDDLAWKAGVQPVHVEWAEAGRLPGREDAKRLAAFFSTTMTALFGQEIADVSNVSELRRQAGRTSGPDIGIGVR